MTDVREPLADLVREVPRHVVPEDLAHTAWAAGRRRRWRRRAALAGASTAVLALLATTVTPVADWPRMVVPAAPPGGQAVDGYPQRIAHQWWLRDMPGRPGPLAGVLYRRPDGSMSPEPWIGVSETGRQWRIPSKQSDGDNRPTLSNTGRYLGYFPHAHRGPFVIHDLVTGELTTFENVVPHMGKGKSSYQPHVQTPSFWSPDDNRLLMFGVSGRADEQLLLTRDGDVRYLGGQGHPIGWVNNNQVAWLERPGKPGNVSAITVTDTRGVQTGTVELPLDRRNARELDQWSGVTKADGSAVAVLVDQGFGDAVLHQFSIADGRPSAEPRGLSGVDDWCQATWAGEAPLVPHVPGDADGRLVGRGGGSDEAVVVTEPGTDARCLVLARDAAAGEPHGGLFGTSTDAWTWWWRELLLAVAGAAALGSGVRRLLGRGRVR